jgi:hypothetical protein
MRPLRRVGARLALFVLCALAFGCGANPAPATTPQASATPPATVEPPKEGTGSIAGTVRAAESNVPLARARVVLTSPALVEPRVSITGPEGTYAFGKLPPGDYRATASRTGYATRAAGERAPASAAPRGLAPGQQIAGADIALPLAGVITGQVRDEDDKPFAGALVEAHVVRTTDGQPSLVPLASTESDDRGNFRLTGLAGGEYYVSAADPAFARAGDETGALRYAPTYYPGTVMVEDASRVTVTPGVEPAAPLVFRLKIVPPARVSGMISTADRRQLLSGNIIMTPLRHDGLYPPPSREVVILPDGSFSFRNVLPGRYQIRARGEVDPTSVALFATFRVTVEGIDVNNVNIVLVPGGAMEGTVRFETVHRARPQTHGVRVRAPLADGSGFGDALTGELTANGAFRIRGLIPGTHFITVEGLPEPWVVKSIEQRGRDFTDEPFAIESLQTINNVRITLTDEANEVSGTVHEGGGQPVARALVLIAPMSKQFWWRTGRRLMIARTDARGGYTIRGLPAGDYRAIAAADLDESDVLDPGVLQSAITAGVPLTLREHDRTPLNLELTSLLSLRGGTSR